MTIEDVARIAHETNRAYCESLGDYSQLQWEHAPDWQKQSAIKGVVSHQMTIQAGTTLPPSHSHDLWLAEKREAGWKYGPVKDPDKKEHPCFVPYEELPPEQQAKDHLFGAVVAALYPFRS